MINSYSGQLLLFFATLGLTTLNFASAEDMYKCAADKWTTDEYTNFLDSDSVGGVTQDFLDAVVQEGIIEFYGLQESPPNPQRGISLLVKATEANHAPAQNVLGTIHLTGWGIDQSSSESAREYFEQAADHQYPPAQNNLAVLYWNGWGVERNMVRAEELFRSASSLGYAPAQSNVGLVLKARGGDTWGGTEAIEMFRAAQEKYFGPAAFNYATYYLEGKAVERDYNVAARSLMIAAKAGDPWAQYNLGQMAALGIGIEQDFVDAYRWLKLSEIAGVSYAQGQVAVIETFLTEAEVLSADIMIEEMEPMGWIDVIEPAKNEEIALSTYDLVSLAPELIASRVKCSEFLDIDMPITWTTSFDWNE